jgi:hypothetical protein
MPATVQVVCNVINPKKLPARPGTQFSFTIYLFKGTGQLGIPDLVKLTTSDPAPFHGSSAQAQVVLLNNFPELSYWISDFVIDTPGGSGSSRGNWNDDYDVDVDLRNYGPFRLVDDDILHGPETELNGKLIPHQIGPR